MRTIKFRGQTPYTREWVVGNVEHYGNGLTHISGLKYAELVIPETVGEFTGFTDLNSVDIYEGDIVQCHGFNEHEKIYRREVVFDLGQFALYDPIMGMATPMKNHVQNSKFCWEVVGNIHENPTLLKHLYQNRPGKGGRNE